MKKYDSMETLQKMETLTEKVEDVFEGDEAESQVKLGIAKAASALTFIAGLNGGWLGPLIPQIAGTQKLPLEKVGLIVSLLCAGCFVTQLIGPKILNKLGGKGSLLAGSALLAGGMLGLSSGHYIEHLLIAAFVTDLVPVSMVSPVMFVYSIFSKSAPLPHSVASIFFTA